MAFATRRVHAWRRLQQEQSPLAAAVLMAGASSRRAAQERHLKAKRGETPENEPDAALKMGNI